MRSFLRGILHGLRVATGVASLVFAFVLLFLGLFLLPADVFEPRGEARARFNLDEFNRRIQCALNARSGEAARGTKS